MEEGEPDLLIIKEEKQEEPKSLDQENGNEGKEFNAEHLKTWNKHLKPK